MNRLYLGLFLNISLSRLFFPYSGHIADTKSVEFACVAISLTFFLKITGQHTIWSVWEDGSHGPLRVRDSPAHQGHRLFCCSYLRYKVTKNQTPSRPKEENQPEENRASKDKNQILENNCLTSDYIA